MSGTAADTPMSTTGVEAVAQAFQTGKKTLVDVIQKQQLRLVENSPNLADGTRIADEVHAAFSACSNALAKIKGSDI